MVPAAGGAAVAAVVAAGVIAVRRHVTDPVLDTVTALITPYAAYVLGATLHVSPVMAVIVAGLAIGARRAKITTAQTRLQLHSVYQTVIFLLESVVFSLIGLQLPTLIRALSHARAWPAEALAVAGTLIAIRILWVFPLSAVIQRRSGTRRPSLAVPAAVSWAGTRGVVPLAAALSIPLTTAGGAPLPRRDLILVLATAVIMISLIIQGLTLEPLARFAGITRPADARHEEPWPGCAWPRQPSLGSTNSPTTTPAPTRSSTVPAPAFRPGSGRPAPSPMAPARSSSTASPNANLSAPRTPNSPASTTMALSLQPAASDSSTTSTWKPPASATSDTNTHECIAQRGASDRLCK